MASLSFLRAIQRCLLGKTRHHGLPNSHFNIYYFSGTVFNFFATCINYNEIIFQVNFYFFLKIISVLYDKIKLSFQLQQKKMEYKKWVRSTFMLVLLFGVQNSLYCVWFFIEKTKPKILFQLMIKVITSFQVSIYTLL